MRLLEKLFDTRDGGVEHVGDISRTFVFIGAAFGDLEDAGFGEVQQIFAGTALWIKARFGDLVRNGDHLAHNGAFAHDICISADVRRTWRVFR
ncbi:hypothetical protein D3C72_1801860 [compost metagenome]